jgi:RNA-directed DNA polymerase
VAGRALAKGTAGQPTRGWTQGRAARSRGLDRGRPAATERSRRWTAWWQHVHAIDRLRAASYSLQHDAAPGVEGPPWATSGAQLAPKLRALADRRKRGASQAPPVERVALPNAAGRPQPSGQPTRAATIVQRATVAVRTALDEAACVGVSSWARPGRQPPQAVTAVPGGRAQRSLPGGRDADRRGLYDAIAPAGLGQVVEHRRGDPRVVRHLRQWLQAGGLAAGPWRPQAAGTPHGGRARPWLAQRSLPAVCDRWAAPWRRRPARGAVSLGRYWEEVSGGVQHRAEAEQGLSERRERGHRGHRALPPEKTRRRAGGRAARARRQRRGQGPPATVACRGVPHLGGTTQRGQCTVRRGPIAQRLRQPLQEVKPPLRERLPWPIEPRGAWRTRGVIGPSRSSGGPRNRGRLWGFRERLLRAWCRPLRRRSQRHRMPWQRRDRRATQGLPDPHLMPPYPAQRLGVTTRGQSPVRECRTPGSVRGGPGNWHPYRDRLRCKTPLKY